MQFAQAVYRWGKISAFLDLLLNQSNTVNRLHYHQYEEFA